VGSVVRVYPGPPVSEDGRQKSDDKSVVCHLASVIWSGGVAQLGERLVCNQEVDGSNPFASTNFKIARVWITSFAGAASAAAACGFSLSRGLFDIVKGGVVLRTTIRAGDFGRRLWRCAR
jgi:hypothetical protein